MPSYQDIETRLTTLALMVEFVMKSFMVQREHPLVPGQMIQSTLLDEYYRVMASRPVDVKPVEDVIEAEVKVD